MIVRRSIKSWLPSLSPNRTTSPSPHSHGLTSPFRRQVIMVRVNQGTLQPCSVDNFYRPKFQTYTGTIRKTKATQDHATLEKIRNEPDDWLEEPASRVRSAGLLVKDSNVTDFPCRDGSAQNPDAAIWANALLMRLTCKKALTNLISDMEEINARKLCADTQDPRYPVLFHSLETQANMLYVIGRVELERPSKTWRPLAHYTLCIAAGLGQLDAALLLHQLEKHNKNFGVPVAQRAVIARAAEERLDWRAMVAQSEYLVARAESRPGNKRLQPAELEECVTLLLDATERMDRPVSEEVERVAPPDGCLDADSMMVFDPPYKLLFNLTLEEITLGNTSEKVVQMFTAAAQLGVYYYVDSMVAGRFAEYLLEVENEYTEEWVHCATIAANDGDAEACFQLAKYHFERDGWSPTLAARISESRINGLRQQQALDGHQNIEEVKESPGFNEKIHQEVLRTRDMNLLTFQEGVSWMKLAAQLPIENAAQILNRYVIIAGLLRLNGFSQEGREVLLEARAQLQDCVDVPSTKARAISTLDEYLEYWDRKLIHQLLYPRIIDQLLNR